MVKINENLLINTYMHIYDLYIRVCGEPHIYLHRCQHDKSTLLHTMGMTIEDSTNNLIHVLVMHYAFK